MIDEGSGVSMVINAVNESAFPINEVTITEPVAPDEFDKFNPSSVRLTIPATTSHIDLVINFSGGTTQEVHCDMPACPTTVAINNAPSPTPPPPAPGVTGRDVDRGDLHRRGRQRGPDDQPRLDRRPRSPRQPQ